MSKIGEYASRRVIRSDRFFYMLAGTLIPMASLTLGLQMYTSSRAPHPNPPVYRDVNDDGIEDKVVQRKVRNKGFLWTEYNTLEDEVLFGVEVNGKKLYLPKDQFEEHQK